MIYQLVHLPFMQLYPLYLYHNGIGNYILVTYYILHINIHINYIHINYILHMQSRLQLHVHPHVYQHNYAGGNKDENVILNTQFLQIL